MPSPAISEPECDAFLKAVEEAQDVRFIVASGSLPAGIPPDIFAKLALIAKNKNSKLIVDTSGDALKHALVHGVFLIKPNLKELALLTGVDELTDDEVPDGALGATLVTKTQVLKLWPPELIVKSTVGAGDSLVAGIVISLANGRDLAEAVQYGVACGSAATLNKGTELCRQHDVDRLFQLIESQIEVVL